MDKETGKIIAQHEEIAAMVKSIGWGMVRAKIFDKIIELNDVSSIKESDPQKLVVTIAAKQAAVEILLEWLGEVEGTAKNSKELRNQFIQKQKDDFVLRFESSEQG